MTDTLLTMIESASGSLTQLTKIRCVESYPLPESCKPKNLFSWPNTRFLDEEEASFLEARGVCLHDSRVKSFSVPYSLYDKMKKVDVDDVAAIERTRALLDVFRIVAEGKPVIGITAAWDTAEHPNRIVPTSTSDAQRLMEFGAHQDSFLVFHRQGEKYDIKLRPIAFRFVLQERPELREFAISREDLRRFVSNKVDSKGRKDRNIVFSSNRQYLRDVVYNTNDAVEKLVGNYDFVSEFKKLVVVGAADRCVGG